MSPQATFLSLGVLLLLAAGVTFLAVTWDSLSVPVQASIIAILAALALAGSVPAARHKLTGTAEAFALALTVLLMAKRTGVRAAALWTATGVVATVNFFVCFLLTDLVQLGLISARVTAQLAIVLVTFDGLFGLWTGAITLAVVGLILLTVGATYERRLQNAKRAARWPTPRAPSPAVRPPVSSCATLNTQG